MMPDEKVYGINPRVMLRNVREITLPDGKVWIAVAKEHADGMPRTIGVDETISLLQQASYMMCKAWLG